MLFVLPFLHVLAWTPVAAAPVPAAAPAEDATAALVRAVQRSYDNTQSFEAEFEQTYQSRIFKRTERSTGHVSYQRPGLMRFDYATPTNKTFLVDGSALWVIQPADHQALVDRCFKADAMTSSLTFLFGQGDLSAQFDVQPGQKAPEGLQRLVLVPKKAQAAYQRLLLDVNPKTSRVEASTVVDSQGNLNRFVFSKALFDNKLARDHFTYSAPPDVQVMPIPGSCNKAP
ncbi:MAG: outer membrane lipoprotein carrier protein LolA [Pseudomonadota bacterium]